MIKFTGEKDGQEFLGLGLERRNWERLLEGKPIVIKPSEIGMGWKGEIMIMGGETQTDMIRELDKLGVLRNVPVKTFRENQSDGE